MSDRDKGIAAIEEAIAQGFHAMVIEDSNSVTVQPLTDVGYRSIQSLLEEVGAPDTVLARLSEKRQGHYVAAVPLQAKPKDLAEALILEHGLPRGSVGLLVNMTEITPIPMGESIN
ncbi:hypothetical protein [Sediminicurvatus halobius]|uniref:Uncharacterized protein n=1 Tax=Sediminicurvatus halobius TaxID=2182432 RepID=A0A2U2MWI7_9GAMM|nr:hypothetical protein [Spiribacter halobius]PWG61156.1 hypothetical protein DEM34_17970 [Spiribacter halobius]UEX78631.1 hypothetical protein LMH63_03010 [Spiribacter halobius]